MAAVIALRSYNQKSRASSSDTPTEEYISSIFTPTDEEENYNNNIHINQNKSSCPLKRKQPENTEISIATAKRPNKEQTLSEKLEVCKQKAMHDAARGTDFSPETNVSELIALADIMFFTPSQFIRYSRDHFNDEILIEWHKSILSTLIVNVEKEARDISNSLNDVIYDPQKKRIKTRNIVQMLVAMSTGKEDYEAQILIGLSNLIQKLPSKNLLSSTSAGETEIWSSTFDPILTALISDPDRDILLRWSNVVPNEDCTSEVIRVQPAAMICEIDQRSWGCTIGYGEAKIEEANSNTSALANDLLRLAFVTAKIVGESKTRSVLAFQIHGYNLKLYITQKMPDSSHYTMVELLQIMFPKSIEELDMFTSTKNIESLISLYKVFWTKCCVKKQDEAELIKDPKSASFDLATIQMIKD